MKLVGDMAMEVENRADYAFKYNAPVIDVESKWLDRSKKELEARGHGATVDRQGDSLRCNGGRGS